MKYFFSHFTQYDYEVLFKIILGSFILLGSLILRSKDETSDSFFRQDRNLLIVFVSLMIFFSGTRGLNIGTDTGNYYQFFFLRGQNISGIIEFFTYFQSDFLFEVIMFITFPFRNFTIFTMATAIVFNTTLYIAIRRFTNYGKNGSSLLLFLTFASLFSFVQLEINIIRNGISIAFILLALNEAIKEEYKKMFIFFIISYLSHGTSLIPIAAILLILIAKNTPIKYYIFFYIMTIGVSIAGFGFHSIPILSSINDGYFERLSFAGETNYRLGFRPDFVLYNTFFLVVVLFLLKNRSREETFLIKYFMITSAIFYLNFSIPFSDRIGLYSWISLPFLIFTTIRNLSPKKHLYYATLGAAGLFILNYVILFP